MPLKLPRYVFHRANGSFRYKRYVPLQLRTLIGKSTLYRQLGDSYKEAMQNLPLVHARIEALLESEKEKSVRDRSIEIIRGALGDEVADMVLANAVPEYSEIEDALNELGKALHKQKLPSEIVEQIYPGKLRQEVITLEMVLKDYIAVNTSGDTNDKNTQASLKALEMLSRGSLSEKSAPVAIGTRKDAYSVAPDIRLKALELVEQDKLSERELLLFWVIRQLYRGQCLKQLHRSA